MDENKIESMMTAFAFSEAVRVLSDQGAELDKIRDRALAQLAFTTAIGSLFLRTIFQARPAKDASFYWMMSGASFAGLLLLLLTFAVVDKVKEWRAKIDPEVILVDYAQTASVPNLVELARYYEMARSSNEEVLEYKRSGFRRATFVSASLIVWLSLSLWVLG